jgi:hypothetical protein
MPGRMDAAQASPVSAWMAVSREQNDHPLVPRTDHLSFAVSAGADGRLVSDVFGRTTQNSLPSGSARTVHDSAPVCPMSTRRAPSPSRRSSASRSSASAVRPRWTPVLDRLRLGHGHEAQSDRRILVWPDDDLALPLGQDVPAEGLSPEPRQPRQVMRVDNDVMKSHRHVVSMRRRGGLLIFNCGGYAFGGNSAINDR